MTPLTFSVYEMNSDGDQNYIGSVEADTLNNALNKAHQQYGAPIEVEIE